MPTYTYRIIETGEEFDIILSIHDPVLLTHPETGQPVEKVITVPRINTKHTPGRTKKMLSNESLAKNGFTKYEKASPGHYIKTAGEGPAEIRR